MILLLTPYHTILHIMYEFLVPHHPYNPLSNSTTCIHTYVVSTWSLPVVEGIFFKFTKTK